jgi:hypothetical protein
MAFVSFCPRASSSMASRVGRTTSVTPRRSASSVTSAITGSPVDPASHHQPATSPGDVLGDGERGVAESLAVRLGGCLPAFPNPSAVDDEVVAVGLAVDLDGSERQVPEAHSTHHRASAKAGCGAGCPQDSIPIQGSKNRSGLFLTWGVLTGRSHS